MNARVRAGLVALLLVLAALPGPHGSSGAGPVLNLAVLPCTNIETTFRKFHPLLNYLKSTTGYTVTLVVPGDLTHLENDAANGRIDFALQDPDTFRQVSHLFDTTRLVQVRSLDGTTSQSGVLVARRDSGVKDIAQLRGKTVMFGPRISSPKWVAARLLFESKGIDVDRDLKVINDGCCEDIAFAVIVKSVDAGVICDHFVGHHGERQKELGVDASALEVIGRTSAVPTRILAARKGVPAAVAAAVARALLELDPANASHAAILSSAEMRGFVRTTEADYLKGIAAVAPPARP
jgi:phosphonate transport system substrate-binding protein